MARYDVAVVGAGPAGLAAALNISVRKKSVIVFGPEISEKLKGASRIDNYLGIPEVSGRELINNFREHLSSYPVEFSHDRVQTIYPMGDYIGLLMPGGNIVEANSVVLAMGINFGKTIPGEEEYLGKGVGTCATCDAALYKNKSVVVIGYQDSSVDEANFISEVAGKTVFVNMTGKEGNLSDGIREIKSKPVCIEGDRLARKLVLEDETIEADGFFFLRDAKKPEKVVPGLELEGVHIKVNSDMSTNIPGIFAAGDCTGTPYQISRAVGQGQIAGLNAARFVTKR